MFQMQFRNNVSSFLREQNEALQTVQLYAFHLVSADWKIKESSIATTMERIKLQYEELTFIGVPER